MKKILVIIALSFALGCVDHSVIPVRSAVGIAGFNKLYIHNPKLTDSLKVYSDGSQLYSGLTLYLDEDKTLKVKEGEYIYKINPVFYNQFEIKGGIVYSLKTRTF